MIILLVPYSFLLNWYEYDWLLKRIFSTNRIILTAKFSVKSQSFRNIVKSAIYYAPSTKALIILNVFESELVLNYIMFDPDNN